MPGTHGIRLPVQQGDFDFATTSTSCYFFFGDDFEDQKTDKDKFPGRDYICETTNVNVSIERTRLRGFAECFDKLNIDWGMLDSHIEGLGDLFSAGKKITFSVEFVYKEESDSPTPTSRSKRKKSATEAQRIQRAAEAGLWTRVYKHHRCRGKHCKQGPHCWRDQQGNHHKLEARHLEDTLNEIKDRMKEGEKEDEVEVDIEIPPRIIQDVLAQSRKRKADNDAGNCRSNKTHVSDHCRHGYAVERSVSIVGDRAQRLAEYCDWTLVQTKSDRWRTELEAANRCAMDHFLELNSMIQHPQIAVDLLVRGGIKPGVALQFVSKSNIEKWWKESQETGAEDV
ncbi:hypothetical protein HD806DRAFT_532248 [Xylariaceae sp. AK1471]|nr:hypothetical protein HD806DRAFT_532248 [Xylariaceae sp. AK1471]